MERQWYYAVGGRERQGPVSEGALRDLRRQGRLQGADLVWTEGMAAWAPFSTIPDLQPTAAEPTESTEKPAIAAAPTPAIAAPIATTASTSTGSLGSWLTFVGIMNIVGGGLTCLSCVGLPMGVLMVMAGSAALSARTALAAVPAPDAATAALLKKFQSYFTMTGWVFILNLVMMVIMIAAYGILFATFAAGLREAMP